MKRCIVILAVLLLPATLLGQWGLSGGRLGMALSRIEHALKTGSATSLGDLLTGTVTLRLGDSLFVDISGIRAQSLLNRFFATRQVVRFDEGLPGSGTLIVSQNGRQDTTRVDVWLQRAVGGPEIRALNISNYPLATVFFDRRKGD